MREARDLGVLFSADLSFNTHIQSIVSSAYRTLGFILRWGRFFKNITTLKLLYCTLVRPKLEYCSIVWSPYFKCHQLLIERVQHKSLRMAAYRLGNPMSITCHDYCSILDRLKLLSLEGRRLTFDLTFIFKLLNHTIDCPDLLERICFNIPTRELKQYSIFHIGYHRTLYNANSCVNRLIISASNFSDRVDFFGGSVSTFKQKLFRLLL